MTKQTRQIPLSVCGIHVRETESEEEKSRLVEGYASVFGVRSVNLTPWSELREVYEVMEPGCFDGLLEKSDVIYNYCHDNRDIFGRSRMGEGTLKLSVDKKGLHFECEMPNTQRANDTLESIRRGDIYGNSFCFTDDEEDTENGVSYERLEEKTPDGKEIWLRHVKRCTGLYDVSTVVTPAYQQAEVSLREMGEKAEKHIEAMCEAQTRSDNAEEEENKRIEEQAERARQEQAFRRLKAQRCTDTDIDIMEMEM